MNLSTLANIEQEPAKLKSKQSSVIFYYGMMIIAIITVGEVLWLAYPYALLGIDQWSSYVNVTWAHDSQLVENLLRILGMLWLSVSALFWGGWFLKRLLRKIKGLQWRINKKKLLETSIVVKSPELKYLTYSCHYLVFVLLFFILQYPLQYLIFPL